MVVSRSLLDFREDVFEKGVVVLDAVVEVQGLAEVGVVVDAFLVGVDFVELVAHFLELLVSPGAVRVAGGVRLALLQHVDLVLVNFLLVVDVARAQARHRVPVVAVDVDERLEAVAPSRVAEPVDGALLVALAVVAVEVAQKVGADGVERGTLAAECRGDEVEVLLQADQTPRSLYRPSI